LVDENLDEIMFDQQLNVDRVNIENVFGNLKIGGGFCIASMHVLIKFSKLWWFVMSFITTTN
jgi:hypothetical protein